MCVLQQRTTTAMFPWRASQAMRACQPSEICFCCPEASYQALVRALSKAWRLSPLRVERDFSRSIELLFARLVERPELLAELVRPKARARRRPSSRPKPLPPRLARAATQSKRKAPRR